MEACPCHWHACFYVNISPHVWEGPPCIVYSSCSTQLFFTSLHDCTGWISWLVDCSGWCCFVCKHLELPFLWWVPHHLPDLGVQWLMFDFGYLALKCWNDLFKNRIMYCFMWGYFIATACALVCWSNFYLILPALSQQQYLWGHVPAPSLETSSSLLKGTSLHDW